MNSKHEYFYTKILLNFSVKLKIKFTLREVYLHSQLKKQENTFELSKTKKNIRGRIDLVLQLNIFNNSAIVEIKRNPTEKMDELTNLSHLDVYLSVQNIFFSKTNHHWQISIEQRSFTSKENLWQLQIILEEYLVLVFRFQV